MSGGWCLAKKPGIEPPLEEFSRIVSRETIAQQVTAAFPVEESMPTGNIDDVDCEGCGAAAGEKCHPEWLMVGFGKGPRFHLLRWYAALEALGAKALKEAGLWGIPFEGEESTH